MKHKILLSVLLACFLASVSGCGPIVAENTPEQEQGGSEGDGQGGDSEGHESDLDEDGEGSGGEEGQQGDEGQEDSSEQGQTGSEDGDTDHKGGQDPVLIEEGPEYHEFYPTVHYPDSLHTVSCDGFVNPVQDDFDEYGNADYVVGKGNGTADPIITSEGWIRIYQGSSASKGGGYIRLRAKNGAKIESVTIISATATQVAYSVNEKISTRTDAQPLAADTPYTVNGIGGCTEVCIWCMATSSSQRLTIKSLSMTYRGGFVEEDYHEEPVEYGPLMGVSYPYTVDFDGGDFPTTDKPSYFKYGCTGGPENLQWSTWFGSFSHQKPLSGVQSLQLRVYQEDTDYDGEQYGYGKMEYFLKGVRSVTLKYYFSEFWAKATISYCEWGSSEWKGQQSIALQSYSDRQTLKTFTYILDGGAAKDAKIRISVDPATDHPSRDHYDLYFDDIVFEGDSYQN